MAIKYFALHSVVIRNIRINIQSFDKSAVCMRLHYLNITSLNSGLLTNFGSILDPLIGCKTGSLIGLIVSQPKQVAKISAKSKVVPSFYK